MYSDTITLFNRYESRLGDMWYPTVIRGVNLNIDKAAIIAKYGSESKDNAVLNIRYKVDGDNVVIADKVYLPPKEWDRQTNDKLAESLTFTGGKDFDFFLVGEYERTDPIADDDYIDGFYNYVNDYYDYVFAITSVAQYSVVQHFEIMGA